MPRPLIDVTVLRSPQCAHCGLSPIPRFLTKAEALYGIAPDFPPGPFCVCKPELSWWQFHAQAYYGGKR
jgi:hypothetical protein